MRSLRPLHPLRPLSPRARARSGAVVLPVVLPVVLVLAACTQTGTSAGEDVVAVTATDDSCEPARTDLAAGTTTFTVTNQGSQTTEFYVHASDGVAIVSEVENIGPGLTRDLTVQLDAGDYVYACKPGGTGEGIRGDLVVTGSGTARATADPRLTTAVEQYRAYVAAEADQLLTKTTAFVAAVRAGDVAAARAGYAPARVHWERIEPVAESFGDIDPLIDARENDVEPGTEWTGWHRLEQQLWASGLDAQAPRLADQLLADTTDLVARIETVTLTPAQLGNGAKELLDEVATGKVTGEEERYSRTDLWDFQANVEGALKAYQVLRPVVLDRDAGLTETLDIRFAEVQAALDEHRQGTGFVGYDTLTAAQVKVLAARVDALGEPLSRLTVTVVG